MSDITPDEARALLQAEEQANQQAFVDAYNGLVKEFGYGFTAVPSIDSDGRIRAGLQLIKANGQSSE